MGSNEWMTYADRQTQTQTHTYICASGALDTGGDDGGICRHTRYTMGDSDRHNLRMKCSSGRTNGSTLNAYVDPRYSTTRASIRKRNCFRLNKWKERRRVLIIKVGAAAYMRKVDARKEQ